MILNNYKDTWWLNETPTHIYRIYVDLLQPKSRSKKSPSTYTWVKNWDKKVQDKFFV